MPQWSPGKQNGTPVSVWYTLPFKFRLEGGSDQNKSKPTTMASNTSSVNTASSNRQVAQTNAISMPQQESSPIASNYNQTQNGPTKEETIAWLKEKLGNYIIVESSDKYKVENIRVQKITECEIEITYEKNWGSNYDRDFFSYTLPTMGCRISSIGTFEYNSEVVKEVRNSKIEYTRWVFVKIAPREDNIYERIQKAINHLTTFCPKKQEAF